MEKINLETYNQIIQADPTYKQESDHGKYVSWLLILFNQEKLKIEDLYKARNYLELFEKNKKYIQEKDILKYKSLPELYSAIQKYEIISRDNVSPSQYNRYINSIKLEDNKNIQLYMSTKNFNIYIPLTYEGSVKLGRNTQWCTAYSKSREAYDKYTKNGKLYVFIDKRNEKIKYQFSDSEKYLAGNRDNTVDLPQFVYDNIDLIDFFINFYPDIKSTIDQIDEIQSGICTLKKKNVYTYKNTLIKKELYSYIKEVISSTKLKIVDFPENIDNLEKLIITKNVELIKYISTMKSNLKSIIVESDNKFYDSRNNCNAIINTKNNELILGCEKTIIPSNVETIGVYAFYSTKIKKIKLPENLKRIDEKAFGYCRSLSKVKLPNSLQYIGDGAFDSCKKLKSVNLPKNLKIICARAFQHCSSLSNDVFIPKDAVLIGEECFSGCNKIKTLKVSEKNSIYDSRNNCNAIIEKATSKLIQATKNTIIPNSVKIIGENSFNDLILKSLVIPNSVILIEKWALYSLTVESIVLSDNIKKISNSSFSGIKKIKQLVLPSKIVQIEDRAFNYTSLGVITLPKSLKYMGSRLFWQSNVKEINYLGKKSDWENIYKEKDWNSESLIRRVKCIDGDIKYTPITLSEI